MLDGVALYGKNEGASMLPSDLDACGGHFGLVPANSTFGIPSETVYHYHIQLEPPYLSGCFGPVNSVQECKALYTARNRGCGTIENVNMGYGVTTPYDLWCPCYEKKTTTATTTTTTASATTTTSTRGPPRPRTTTTRAPRVLRAF